MDPLAKLLSIYLAAIGAFASILACGGMATSGRLWTLAAVATAGLAAVVIAGLLRKDKAPDLLWEIVGPYYEAHGFCFGLGTATELGHAVLRIYYQNRYARSCHARIELEPRRGLIFRPALEPISVEFDCVGGEFGVVHVPWAVPATNQGKQIQIVAALRAMYPEGRGEMLRFRSAASPRPPMSGIWRFAPMRGMPGIEVLLPEGVVEELPPKACIRRETMWLPAAAAVIPPRASSGKMPKT